jgi:hypothetical protein
LWLKNTLSAFAEMNVGAVICKEYEVGAKDFGIMSLIMAEERAIEQEADADRKAKDPEGD